MGRISPLHGGIDQREEECYDYPLDNIILDSHPGTVTREVYRFWPFEERHEIGLGPRALVDSQPHLRKADCTNCNADLSQSR